MFLICHATQGLLGYVLFDNEQSWIGVFYVTLMQLRLFKGLK